MRPLRQRLRALLSRPSRAERIENRLTKENRFVGFAGTAAAYVFVGGTFFGWVKFVNAYEKHKALKELFPETALMVFFIFLVAIILPFGAWFVYNFVRRHLLHRLLARLPAHGFCEHCFYAAPMPLPDPPAWTCPECGLENRLEEAVNIAQDDSE
jgi:hypothetical protein